MLFSSRTTLGNDDIPLLNSTPVPSGEGAQRVMDTINVLHQSLGLVVIPNPHGHGNRHALMKLLGQNISDFVRLYQKADNHTIFLQQLLDAASAQVTCSI